MGEAWDVVIRFMQNRNIYERLYPLVQYVHSQWMVRVGARRLSVYGQIHTTDNGPETLHRMLNDQAPRAHPNLWEVVGELLSLFS
jgi:hypothetical protein